MRNSTGSPIFSDFKSDLFRVAAFQRPLVKRNEDPGYEGGELQVCTKLFLTLVMVC